MMSTSSRTPTLPPKNSNTVAIVDDTADTTADATTDTAATVTFSADATVSTTATADDATAATAGATATTRVDATAASSATAPTAAAPAAATTAANATAANATTTASSPLYRYYHASDRVLILGAGIAGLACARELQARGYQVLVVEARSRLGGRLKSSAMIVAAPAPTTSTAAPVNNQQQHYIDLGGSLIHGVDDNPLTDLAKEIGLPLQPVGECLLLDTSGWPVDPKEDERVSNIFNECLEESFRQCSSQEEQQQDDTNNTENEVSFGDVFENVCLAKSVFNNVNTNNLLRWHQANLEVSCGASFADLGTKWNEDEPYGFDGDHAASRHSWKSLVEALGEGLDILYNAPVKYIYTATPDPASNSVRSSNNNSSSKTNPSQTTTSSSKRGAVAPLHYQQQPESLPSRQSRRLRGEDASFKRRSGRRTKGQAEERYTVGHTAATADNNINNNNNNKPEPSSSKQQQQHQKIGTFDKMNKYPRNNKTVVQVTLQNGTVLEANHVVCSLPLGILKLDATDDEDEEPGAIVFDPPLPLAKQQAIRRLGAGLLNKCALSFPRAFWQDSDFLGLAAASEGGGGGNNDNNGGGGGGNGDNHHSYLVLNAHAYTGRPILVFWYGGAFAKDVEDWTDAEIVDDCLKVLKRICGGGQRRSLPEPLLDYRVTRWGHEQYSRMAFTYVPPGVDGFVELQAMGDPIYDHTGEKPTLLFAGEHTNPYHPSTIHGAFLSGIREAYRLDCALYPKENNNMVFTNTELYERTFSVKRRFFGANSLPVRVRNDDNNNQQPAVAVDEQEPATTTTNRHREPQHRRRGAAGAMKLRRRPDTKASKPAAAAVALSSSMNGIPFTSPRTRRSPRAPVSSTTKMVNGRGTGISSSISIPVAATAAVGGLMSGEAHPDYATAANEPGRLTALENETLLRGMESYGRDYEYLQATTMPVHGSNTDTLMTPEQVRKRCQQLQGELRNRRAVSTTSWKRWVAKTVFGSPPEPTTADHLGSAVQPRTGSRSRHLRSNSEKELPAKKDSAKRKLASNDTSTSYRVALNPKDLIVAKTKSGRTVYKPLPLLEGVNLEEMGSPSSKRPRTATTREKKVKTRSGRLVHKPDLF